MRYNIHLWQLDETGHWTKYAVGRKYDGSVTNERDTEATNPPLVLIDAQFGFGIPTADTARWAISVFNTLLRGCLPTAETRKVANESGGICIETAMSFLNPTPPIQGGDTVAEGMGGCFFSALLSYPRFITPSGGIEIGGVDYLDLWQDNKPLPHNRFTTPEEILAEERRKRGGFDETVAMFCDTVKWIGESTQTSMAARCAIGKINALVRAFTSLGFADILRIDERANEAAEALQAMCNELAGRKDAQPATAQAADGDEIVRKVADAVGGQVLAKLGEVQGEVRNIRVDTTTAALNITTINKGVAWLVGDRQKKIKGNKKRGKINQATGNTEESERAAQDMQTALNRVHDRMKHGAKNVIGECRKVCKEFEPLTTKKNELGKFELYAPLTGVDGRPIKPDTLAKNYRERFGTKKAKKASTARTAKPKRRIK